MKAAVIGNGSVDDYNIVFEELKKYDYIICADGGMRHLYEMDISPDVFIGDFDSCKCDDTRYTRLLKQTRIIRHNPMKDDTDMQLCIDYAIDNGFDEITLFGALGGRIDHELSNIFHLKYMLEKNVRGSVFSEKNRIYITSDSVKLKKETDFKVSLIPLTQKVSGVFLKGMLYPLEDAVLVQGTSLGISNEFISDTAEITIKEGILLVFLSKD